MRAFLQGEPSPWPFLFCAVTAAAVVGFAVMCGLLEERREEERVRRVCDLIADGFSQSEAERVA